MRLPEPTRVTEHVYSSVCVVAGPLGFYGRAYGVYFGRRRDTRQEALSDAVDAAELIEKAGAAGAIAAHRMF